MSCLLVVRQVDYFSGGASNFLLISSLSLGGTKGGGTVG